VNIQEIISSGLLEMYATGNTTPEENAQVQALVAQHPEVKAELAEVEKALEAYAFANAVQPKIQVQHKLFSQLNFDQKEKVIEKNNVFNFSTLKKLAAAAVILLIGSAILNVIFYSKFKEISDLAKQNNDQIEQLKNQTKEVDNEMKIVQSKYSLPLKMNGSELAPEADAKIYWLTNTGEIFIDPRNLPPTPAGKQYQLWAIVDGKAIDAGLIKSSDGRTFRLQQMKTFGKAQAFAITLEVEGGVAASKEKPFAIVKL
jgi:anti-sigma-K factor RskA